MESTASEQQSKRPETTSKRSRSQDFADGSSAAKISRSTNDSLYRVNRRATTKTSSREELHKELIQQEISKNKLQKKNITGNPEASIRNTAIEKHRCKLVMSQSNRSNCYAH